MSIFLLAAIALVFVQAGFLVVGVVAFFRSGDDMGWMIKSMFCGAGVQVLVLLHKAVA